MTDSARSTRLPLLAVLGPGLLVAATGVGAGDLAMGALAGQKLGVAVLWAAAVGALFKFALTEGLTRYQIATGETLLEGVLRRIPRAVRFAFLLYLLPWTWFVGAALISACGVATHALLPWSFTDAATGKVVFGTASSLVGLVLVWFGGYAVFENVMRVCIGLMFVVTLATAALVAPSLGELASGMVPFGSGALASSDASWTVALIGGVGGTLTILCYGYWIREEGRSTPAHLGLCRADLAIGYTVTALFGMAMVVLGSELVDPETTTNGANLIVALGDGIAARLGTTVRYLFLIGTWCAVFSSLLGVWQAVPYLFADFWRLAASDTPRAPGVDTRSRPYRIYLLAIALVPLAGLGVRFAEAQKAYALVGALFVPLLAVVLLLLNGRRTIVGTLRNGPLTTLALISTLAFFVAYEIIRRT